MLHYVLQPRPHPGLEVDVLYPVVRPDPAQALRREFSVGKRLDKSFAHRPHGHPVPHRLQLLRDLLDFLRACLDGREGPFAEVGYGVRGCRRSRMVLAFAWFLELTFQMRRFRRPAVRRRGEQP